MYSMWHFNTETKSVRFYHNRYLILSKKTSLKNFNLEHKYKCTSPIQIATSFLHNRMKTDTSLRDTKVQVYSIYSVQ